MYSDPADNDNPEPNGAPAPRVPARTPGRRAKKGSPKVLMIGAAVAVLVIVGYAVAVHVAGGYERGLRATVESAEAKLLEGDFDGAKKLVAEASGLIDSGRDKLSAEGRIELRKRTDAASRAVAIHEDARKALSEMAGDPTAKREHIEDLVRSASQNYPRQKKLHEALREMAAKALDEERRIGKAKVDEALSAVREAIRQDPFGDAGKKLSETEELLEEFSRALADESKDSSKKEVERLRELVALADEAKGKAEDYKGRPKERKEQITVLIGRLGEDEESKALADRLGRVVGEAQKEIDAEVAAKTKELEHTVRYVTGQDDRITYDPKKFDLENKIVPFEVAGRTVEFQADPSFSRWRMKIGDRNFDFRFNARQIPPPTASIVWMALNVAEGLEKIDGAPKGDWRLVGFSPMPAASMEVGAGMYKLYFDGKLYEAANRFDQREYVMRARRFIYACQALHRAVEGDTGTPEEIRRIVAYMVGATYRGSRPGDFITIPFIREAVMLGYVEAAIPEAAERLKANLDAYRAAYRKFTQPLPLMGGSAEDGSELAAHVTSESPFQRVFWRVDDKAAGKTFFYVSHPDRGRTGYHVRARFDGSVAEWADGAKPEALAMVHRSVGKVAGYSPPKGTLEADRAAWATSARCEYHPARPAYHGRPEWHFPPHLVIVDRDSKMLGVVTRHGRLDMPEPFSRMEDPQARARAHEEFLDRAAKLLKTPGELYFVYKYFVQYALDSPVETRPNLLGSSQHSGDIHQDYHQFLDRQWGGLFIGDCDDVAELYQNIVKRQGKLAFVLDVPGHATCGWVAKDTDVTLHKRGMFPKEKERLIAPYSFTFLDTGVPRSFTHDELDKVIEAGVKSYDENNQIVFNPNDVVFLFRFAGEQTRTPYVLGTQMFVDPVYAETLRTVQGHWHFHFYSLGIETMLKLLETDKAPRNCFEVAELYRAVGEADEAIKWHRVGMGLLPEENLVSRVGTYRRMVNIYWGARRREDAHRVLGEAVALLESYEKKQGKRHAEQRFQVAGFASGVGKPWLAYSLVEEDIRRLQAKGKIGRANGQTLAGVYRGMKELIDSGRKPAPAEQAAYEAVGATVRHFVDTELWEADDGFNSSMIKYATLASYYAGKHGVKRLHEELLKDGPHPGRARMHFIRRRVDEDEDWKWIRAAMMVYHMEIMGLLDPDEPEKLNPELAARLVDAMERSAVAARKLGSLSSMEYFLLMDRLTRAGIRGTTDDFEPILKEVRRRNFGRLYQQASEALGFVARFMKADDFDRALGLFRKYVEPRPHYFNLVYKAYLTDAFDAARAAAKVSLERFPEDENMKHESRYLEKLIRNRLEEKKRGVLTGEAARPAA